MANPRQITVIQAAAVLTSTVIGVGVLPLSLFAVRAAGSGAPLVTLLGLLLSCAGVIILTVLGMRFPRQSIIEYSALLIGVWPARILGVCKIVFFATLTALTAREFGEVVITAVLTRTPVEVTVIVMLLLAAISTRNNITTIAYIHHFYFPLLIAPAVVIVILSLKNAEAINLQPLWGNQTSGKGMLDGVLTIAALFQGSFVVTTVIPAMRRPERALTAAFWGMLISGGLYVAIVIATVGVFGSEEIKKLLWPTLELAKTTSLPANILERLDAAFLAVWVTAVFTTLLSSYYLTLDAMSKLFQLKEHKMFSMFILPFVFVVAMIPQNILELYKLILTFGKIGLIYTIGFPALLLPIAMIRKKRGKRDGQAEAN